MTDQPMLVLNYIYTYTFHSMSCAYCLLNSIIFSYDFSHLCIFTSFHMCFLSLLKPCLTFEL